MAADASTERLVDMPEYADNPTVFGRILEGSLPASIVEETETVLCFHDISPASEHHILIIPKRRI